MLEVLRAAIQEAGSAKKLDEMLAKDLQARAQQQGFRPITVDIGLFGRMTTSEAFRDVEAACQVAHAISTHKFDNEFDYFTAVDDLKDSEAEIEEDSGAGMIGDVEFTSACYYKYFSVDLDGLCHKLTGENAGRKEVPADECAEAARIAHRAVIALLKAAIQTTPSGKQNTFAAHQLPAAVLVEIREAKTPISYANAFVEPAYIGKNHDLVKASLTKFATHVQKLTTGFNLQSTTRLLLAPEYGEFNDCNIAGVDMVPDLATLCARLTAAMENEVLAMGRLLLLLRLEGTITSLGHTRTLGRARHRSRADEIGHRRLTRVRPGISDRRPMLTE